MIERVLKMLRKFEFSGEFRDHGATVRELCPVCCGYDSRKHKPDCELKAVIKAVSDGAIWPRPIPVSERLPELEPWGDGARRVRYSESVLYFCGSKYNDGTIKNYQWFLGSYTEDLRVIVGSQMCWTPNEPDGDINADDLELVTHWMPLPPKPNE